MPSNLTPDEIQDLVTYSFCLEVLSDKDGCTTRYKDIPGKPLHDFISSAIVSGKYFRLLARDIVDGKNPGVFDYLLNALLDSRKISSSKLINFGLLQMMFIVVYVRLIDQNPRTIFESLNNLVKRKDIRDVDKLGRGHLEAWKDSTKNYRRNFQIPASESIYDFYLNNIINPIRSDDIGGIHWTEEFVNGFPTIRHFYDYFEKTTGSLAERIKGAYDSFDKKYIRIGVIADMCAVAIFLHLSFQQP